MPASRAKPPFLTDDELRPISRTEFRRLRNAEKLEMMRRWFFQNFENPAENTPYESAEGGYQYIWGGPFEADEQLGDKFGGIASDRLIQQLVNELQREAFEWAPVQKAEDWEDIDWSERYDEPESLDFYKDEPSARYGTLEEREERAKVIVALTRLENSLQRRRPGIGHNQPPDEIEPVDVREVRQAAHELKLEFGQGSPRISAVKRWAAPLRNALVACGKWAARS